MSSPIHGNNQHRSRRIHAATAKPMPHIGDNGFNDKARTKLKEKSVKTQIKIQKSNAPMNGAAIDDMPQVGARRVSEETGVISCLESSIFRPQPEDKLKW